MHVSNLFYNEWQPELARRLSDLSGLAKAFFCNSGAEANEALIKLVRLWGNAQGRNEIITFEGSFHGRTLAAITATAQPKYHEGFQPLPGGFQYATFNDIESVEALITDKTAAILVEPVQGEGGVRPASSEFLQSLRALCDAEGILLVFDEVQCGMGRTGQWFAGQSYDVQPDAMTLAKALGSGFPIGALLAGQKLADVFQPGHHASTFGGTPLACAAALATLDVIEEEELCQRASIAGAAFLERLRGLIEKHDGIETVRGRGLMIGIVVRDTAAPYTAAMMEHGLIALPTAGNVIRLLPPLNASDEDFDKAFNIIEMAFEAVSGSQAD